MNGNKVNLLLKLAALLLTLLISVLFVSGCSRKQKGDVEDLKDYITSVKRAESGTTIEVGPYDDYVTAINNLKPGDELVLHEGTYYGPFNINVSGTPDKPIIIRGFGQGEKRPVLFYAGGTANLMEIYGNNLVLAYLEFRPPEPDVHAIRIKPEQNGVRSNILIENCVFRDCGGGSIDANIANGVYEKIKIINNRFIGVKATPVYIGEHSGTARVDEFVFEGNFIEASQIDNKNVVGYGIELKLNVKGGIIRNNLIMNSQGPGIMVYGAKDAKPEDANIVEGNIVVGSRNSAGIVVGAGPSVVRNNIVLGCSGGGISALNYGGWNLFEHVTIEGNTVGLNTKSDFYVDEGYRNTSSFKAEDNLVIPGDEGFQSEEFGEKVIKAIEGDEELAEMIENLKVSAPELPQLKKAWAKMEKGPFNLKQVKEILDELV